MKTRILLLCLLPVVGFAQTVPPVRRSFATNESAQAFPENYKITLTMTEKDKSIAELALVVSSPEFRAEMGEPAISFSGTLTPEENGTILVRYTLGSNLAVTTQTMTTNSPSGQPVTSSNVQYVSSSAQTTTRLHIGEPLQILKSGGRVYVLTVARLGEGAKKAEK